MKKILSFTLILVLLIGACVSVCAVDADASLEQKFYDYCVDVLPEDMKPAGDSKAKIMDTLEIEGVEVFSANCGKVEKKSVYKNIGDWRVYSGYTYYPYELGVYVCSGDEIYTLEEAYEAGYITDFSSLQYHQLGGSDHLTFINVKNEDKYADLILPEFLNDYACDFGLCVSYYEGYEYFSPDNTSTGDEATPDYVVIALYSNFVGNMFTADVFGDYIMTGEDWYFPFKYGIGIYIPEAQEVLDLVEAYDRGIEGIDKLFTECTYGKLIGDMDNDRKLTVKDATHIQKCIAGLEDYFGYINAYNADEKPPLIALSDFDRDCKVTIKDATAIQKYIAGLEY